jgi:hypothetical protein
MKKTVLLLLFFVMLTSCAGTGATGISTAGRSLAEDPGSPEKVDLLRQRANEFWESSVKGDFDSVYYFYDPYFRARNPDKSQVIGNLIGRITYHGAEVKDIQVEGNVATVTVSLVYSVPELQLKTQVFKVPETPTEFQETWLYIYDNWYKEYYSAMMERGFAEY